MRVITAEARSYLGVTSVGHRRYDVVVSDCFGGAEPVRELATVEALRLVRGSLNAGGIYVANIVSASEGSDVTFPWWRLRCHGTRGIRPRLGGPMWRCGVRRRGKLPAHRQRRQLRLCRSRALRHRLPRHRPSRQISLLVPKRLVLGVVAPAENALLHAFDVEHAFGKAPCARALREQTRRSSQSKAPRRDRRGRWGRSLSRLRRRALQRTSPRRPSS